nr:hypothetical protein [uncultured Mediterranean phage uvMED]
MIKITLNKIKAHDPCQDGWEKLLAHLGKTEADDQEFPLAEVLKSNGLTDALWCLRCLPEHKIKWQLLAVKFSRQVQHLMKDERSINALDVAERYANGEATDSELKTARDAAEDARTANAWGYLNANLVHWSAAAWAARDAAIAASYTLRHIVWTATYSAWAATHSAAQDAPQDAAWDAAREKQVELFLEAIA